MIHMRGLTVQFGTHKVIDNLHAMLCDPVCGLIGPNGAGKTTLVNALSGIVQPVTGEIVLDGFSLIGLSAAQRVKNGLRRSFQTEQVVEDLNVWDNLQAVLDHVSMPRASRVANGSESAIEHIAKILDYTGLTSVATTLGATLNLFQRRMVEVAKALVGQPRLLLFDEPAAGLTAHESLALQHTLLGIHAFCGAQIVLIDHDVSLIAAVCSETLVLDFGRPIALGSTEDVLSDPIVRRAYLGT